MRDVVIVGAKRTPIRDTLPHRTGDLLEAS